MILVGALGATVPAACNRDLMSPGGATRAISLVPVFPRSFQHVSDASAPAPFSSVRAMIVRASGAVVADTTVTFPASADSVALQFSVPASADSAGEALNALVWCMDAAGDTVFKGGPVRVVLTTDPRAGATVVPLVYTGGGSGGGGGGDSTGIVATALAIATQPVTSIAGTALTLTVDAVDATGGIVTTFTGPVSILLGSNPGSAALGGTLTAIAVNGVATFANVVLNKAGSAYTLVASASTLTSATSQSFGINPAAPSVIAIAGGNSQSGILSALLGTPLSVIVHDAYGNATAGVNVAWTVASGGGALANATTQTASSGIATDAWTLGAVLGQQTVTAAAAGLSSAVTFTATATALAATVSQLVMSAIPSSAVAGSSIAQTLTVTAEDASGNVVNTFTGPVQLALGSNPAGGALGGTTSANAVNGVATFTNVVLTKAASGYTLVANGDGLSSPASSAFAIVAGAPASITKQGGDNQSGLLALAGILLANPLSVLVADSYGNPVSGATVNWVVSAGNAALGTATSTTNSAGIATNSLTLLGLVAGVSQVTASIGGSASVVFSATGIL